MNQLAKNFGVTPQAINKWCKSYGIEKPPKEHWDKVANTLAQFGIDLDGYYVT